MVRRTKQRAACGSPRTRSVAGSAHGVQPEGAVHALGRQDALHVEHGSREARARGGRLRKGLHSHSGRSSGKSTRHVTRGYSVSRSFYILQYRHASLDLRAAATRGYSVSSPLHSTGRQRSGSASLDLRAAATAQKVSAPSTGIITQACMCRVLSERALGLSAFGASHPGNLVHNGPSSDVAGGAFEPLRARTLTRARRAPTRALP